MRAKEFLLEVDLSKLAQTPLKGGITLGDAIAQKMMKSGTGEFDQDPIHSLELISAADPTNNNSMTKWLSKIYLSPESNFIVPEDTNQIKADLTKYMKLKNQKRLKPEHSNLDAFKTLDDLYNAIESYEDVTSKKEQKKIAKHEGADTIIKEPGFMVVHTKTYEANCHYGKGTKWCTAGTEGEDGKNYFDDYNKQGPLYAIFAGQGVNQKKYQFHYESDQFLNARDKDVNSTDIALLSKYPGWAKFLNMQIKEHYGKYFEQA